MMGKNGLKFKSGDLITGKDRSYERSLYQVIEVSDEESPKYKLKLMVYSYDVPTKDYFCFLPISITETRYRICKKGELKIYLAKYHDGLKVVEIKELLKI